MNPTFTNYIFHLALINICLVFSLAMAIGCHCWALSKESPDNWKNWRIVSLTFDKTRVTLGGLLKQRESGAWQTSLMWKQRDNIKGETIGEGQHGVIGERWWRRSRKTWRWWMGGGVAAYLHILPHLICFHCPCTRPFEWNINICSYILVFVNPFDDISLPCEVFTK